VPGEAKEEKEIAPGQGSMTAGTARTPAPEGLILRQAGDNDVEEAGDSQADEPHQEVCGHGSSQGEMAQLAAGAGLWTSPTTLPCPSSGKPKKSGDYIYSLIRHKSGKT
jgi:hypothetical protein